jgi:hypothetical protein
MDKWFLVSAKEIDSLIRAQVQEWAHIYAKIPTNTFFVMKMGMMRDNKK